QRVGLPREPGGRLCQDLPLHAELTVPLPAAAELLLLSARQAVGRLPSSRPAWRSQLWMVCSVGSNSRASSGTERPARARATICSRNAAGYGGRDRGMTISLV